MIVARVLFELTVYLKKGGNIQVATTGRVSELLLVVETPVKIHPLSLARAFSAMVEKPASYQAKWGCIIQKIDILFWRVRHYIGQKKTPSLHKNSLCAKYDAYWSPSHLKLFGELATLIF